MEAKIWVIVLLVIIAISITVKVSMYTSDSAEIKALQSQGFKSIDVGGWALWGCSDSDATSKHFTAINANNKQVSGVICCGYFKRCTIRW